MGSHYACTKMIYMQRELSLLAKFKIGKKDGMFHEISFINLFKINIIRIAKLVMPFDSAESGLQPGHFHSEIGFSNREIQASFGLKLT